MEVQSDELEVSSFDYKVEQDSFSGPLDLLLHLIRKDEVDIFDIDIARLTDQYVTFIKGISLDNIENAGDFLIMAATLLEIKSRALLPRDDSDVDEESGEEDLRANLIQQLLEYKKFKSLSKGLLEYQEEFLQSYPSQGQYKNEGDENDSPVELQVSLNSLMLAISKVVKDTSLEMATKLRTKLTPISHYLEKLANHLKSGPTSFFKMKEEYQEPVEVISCFMSILEMCKSRSIHAEQPKAFGDIFVVTRDESATENNEAKSGISPDMPMA